MNNYWLYFSQIVKMTVTFSNCSSYIGLLLFFSFYPKARLPTFSSMFFPFLITIVLLSSSRVHLILNIFITLYYSLFQSLDERSHLVVPTFKNRIKNAKRRFTFFCQRNGRNEKLQQMYFVWRQKTTRSLHVDCR